MRFEVCGMRKKIFPNPDLTPHTLSNKQELFINELLSL